MGKNLKRHIHVFIDGVYDEKLFSLANIGKVNCQDLNFSILSHGATSTIKKDNENERVLSLLSKRTQMDLNFNTNQVRNLRAALIARRQATNAWPPDLMALGITSAQVDEAAEALIAHILRHHA